MADITATVSSGYDVVNIIKYELKTDGGRTLCGPGVRTFFGSVTYVMIETRIGFSNGQIHPRRNFVKYNTKERFGRTDFEFFFFILRVRNKVIISSRFALQFGNIFQSNIYC